MKYYCYVARCADNTLYTGSSQDIKAREERHNQGRGAKYTRQRRPIKIIYFEAYTTLGEAMKRECEIKKWPKSKKEKLIQDRRSEK